MDIIQTCLVTLIVVCGLSWFCMVIFAAPTAITASFYALGWVCWFTYLVRKS